MDYLSLNGGGGAGGAPMSSRAAAVRALDTTFAINLRPVLVTYAVRIACAAGERGTVQLRSDAGAPPTTVLSQAGAGAGTAGGGGPAVIGSIDGLTVPGTPTFTGTAGVTISQPVGVTGNYDLVLPTPLNLDNGAGATAVLTVSPSQVLGPAVAANDASLFYYIVTDPTHVTIMGWSTIGTRKDWKGGITISAIAGGGGGGGGSTTDVLVSGLVYPGQNVRIVTIQDAGAPVFTYLSGMEVSL